MLDDHARTLELVGNVPREFLRVFWHFLRHGGTITCGVTGRRKRCEGLEIPSLVPRLSPRANEKSKGKGRAW